MTPSENLAAAQDRHSVPLDAARATVARLRLALICGMSAPEVAQLAADELHQMADICQGGAA